MPQVGSLSIWYHDRYCGEFAFSQSLLICNYSNSLSSSNVGELSQSWSHVAEPTVQKTSVLKTLGKKTWVIHLVRLYYLSPVNCILYNWPGFFIWKSCLTPNLWLIIQKIGLQKLLCPGWPKKDEIRIAILTPRDITYWRTEIPQW